MLQLLSHYSISQILLFLVFVAIAFKGVVDFIDWYKNRVKKHDDQVKEEHEYIKEINEVKDSVGEIKEVVNDMKDIVNTLMESDRDAIKSHITREHHYFCYQKGWIDDYSLDCVEKRYKHYLEEDGNSFIGQLMEEIRALPKQPKDGEGV